MRVEENLAMFVKDMAQFLATGSRQEGEFFFSPLHDDDDNAVCNTVCGYYGIVKFRIIFRKENLPYFLLEVEDQPDKISEGEVTFMTYEIGRRIRKFWRSEFANNWESL